MAERPYLGVYENMDFPEYQFREYPKMLYINGESLVVNNHSEELRAADKLIPVEQVKVSEAALQSQIEALQAQLAAANQAKAADAAEPKATDVPTVDAKTPAPADAKAPAPAPTKG